MDPVGLIETPVTDEVVVVVGRDNGTWYVSMVPSEGVEVVSRGIEYACVCPGSK
jgi:hypothetical protein